MIHNKKAQGIGGLLKVVIIGIMFLAFFPFLSVSIGEAANVHTGLVSFLISAVLIVVVYLFISFAFNLGADS